MSTPKENEQYRVQDATSKINATAIEGYRGADNKRIFLVKHDGMDNEISVDVVGFLMNYHPIDVDTANWMEPMLNDYLIAEAAAKLEEDWPVKPVHAEDLEDAGVDGAAETSVDTGYVGYGEMGGRGTQSFRSVNVGDAVAFVYPDGLVSMLEVTAVHGLTSFPWPVPAGGAPALNLIDIQGEEFPSVVYHNAQPAPANCWMFPEEVEEAGLAEQMQQLDASGLVVVLLEELEDVVEKYGKLAQKIEPKTMRLALERIVGNWGHYWKKIYDQE